MDINQAIKMNFNAIDSKEDFTAKCDFFLTSYRDTGAQFNQFVRSTVHYFFHGGEKNVQVINRLLEVAYFSKGLNHSRLLAYLEQCIPHVAHSASVSKAKGTEREVRKAPFFSGKIKGREYDWAETQAFLAVNLQWFKYGREVSHTAYSLKIAAATVAKAAVAHGITAADFNATLMAEYFAATEEKAKKAAGKASR